MKWQELTTGTRKVITTIGVLGALGSALAFFNLIAGHEIRPAWASELVIINMELEELKIELWRDDRRAYRDEQAILDREKRQYENENEVPPSTIFEREHELEENIKQSDEKIDAAQQRILDLKK